MTLKKLPKALADTCVGKHPTWPASQVVQRWIQDFKRSNLSAEQVATKTQAVVDDLLEVVAAFTKADAKPKAKKK